MHARVHVKWTSACCLVVLQAGSEDASDDLLGRGYQGEVESRVISPGDASSKLHLTCGSVMRRPVQSTVQGTVQYRVQ